ncbi:NAD/ferredoxin-dependent reductase-like protein [Cryobacterium psychrophilum]|nr:NAD/ferredoxin-dependent reductase-like protein [Cryobacterium psychrophilum]
MTIVGAGLAGHASAKALRLQGFDGRVTIIGDEIHRPYDRPPLSKDFLAGAAQADELTLEAEGEDLQAEWLLGARAASLDPGDRQITLTDGGIVRSDVVIIASGSFARCLPGVPAGVHTLRTLDDAIALRAELVSGALLVVVGSGFIGLEVASTARSLGLEVTVLGSSGNPLSRSLGVEVGTAVQRLHEANGIVVRNNTVVEAVLGSERVIGVRLSTGEMIPADVVVMGIGSLPAIEWLSNSGLDIRGGLMCDEVGATAADGVIGVGDCSAWFDPVRGRHHRVEHWSDSRERPATAVAALLSGRPPARGVRPSYLWSDQCGAKIQFAGRVMGDETIAIEAGDIDSGDLLMVYRQAERPVAVVGINQPRLVAQWRKRLASLETG